MSKDDYKDKFEEHRQNIDGAEEETTQKMSRTERYRGEKGDKPQKKKRHLMEYLSITFILILLSILIFVALFYEPGKDVKQVVNDEDEVEVVKDGEPAKKEDADKEKAKEKEEQEALAKKKAEEAQKAEEERKAKEQQEKQAAEQAEQARKAEEERKAQAAEAARQAEQARQAEAARQAEQQKAQQQQKPQTPQVRTHTVQAGETLYRIGVNYYGSGDESVLQKIRAANGLSSNTIQVGQQIKLP